ncbi:DUF3488 and transglutaminase-like domain-containing protein [Homoserinibacter gongjuensis]|uniref:Transglutaminase-like domain-containing protein n=1 Tax=Homoserinibacter gongjuensis TaxID=1162968 RepID=A0ABQ6JU18_9MICO|nr:DUF3488 and transglutaminase-like domain-containing protein [Homoserinibacter gongjuensis]GMA91783.1 hypothetical protein GCM10025869_23120 [Homoserinibacter gongjuensis]
MVLTDTRRPAPAAQNPARSPRRPRPANAPWARTVLVGAALVAALASLHVTLQGISWWLVGTIFVFAVLFAAAAVRRLLRGRAWPPIISAAVGVALLTLIYAADTAILGVIPTLGTLGRFGQIIEQGITSIVEQRVPATPELGIVLLLAVLMIVCAWFADVVVAARKPALVALPLAAILAVPLAIKPGLIDALWYLVTAALYLAVLRIGRPRDSRRAVVVVGAAVALGSLLLPYAIPGVEEQPASRTSGLRSGINPLITLGDDLRRGDPTLALSYTSSANYPVYLRLTTLDRFTGGTWGPIVGDTRGDNLDAFPFPAGLTQATAVNAAEVDVTVADVFTNWLPTPYPTTSITGVEGDWFWEPDGLTVRSVDTGARGQQYTAAFLEPRPTSEQLAATTVFPADAPEGSLALPGDMPAIVVDTAHQVADAAASAYDKALALQTYLRGVDFSYSEEAPVDEGFDGTGMDALAIFLERKTGYCVHYASAMAVMARELGIPSRVAVGFQPGDRRFNDGSNLYEVSTDDLHAWPELYFDDIGWLRFEPTPGRGRCRGTARPSSTTPRLPRTRARRRPRRPRPSMRRIARMSTTAFRMSPRPRAGWPPTYCSGSRSWRPSWWCCCCPRDSAPVCGCCACVASARVAIRLPPPGTRCATPRVTWAGRHPRPRHRAPSRCASPRNSRATPCATSAVASRWRPTAERMPHLCRVSSSRRCAAASCAAWSCARDCAHSCCRRRSCTAGVPTATREASGGVERAVQATNWGCAGADRPTVLIGSLCEGPTTHRVQIRVRTDPNGTTHAPPCPRSDGRARARPRSACRARHHRTRRSRLGGRVRLRPALRDGGATCASDITTPCRAAIEWRSDVYGPTGAGQTNIKRRTLFSVYAVAGERILLGSSSIGVGSADAVVWNPGLISETEVNTLPNASLPTPSYRCTTQRQNSGNTTLGVLDTRAKELAGPRAISGGGNAAGYVPCYYTVQTTGIHRVAFYGSAGAGATGDGTVNPAIAPAGTFDKPTNSSAILAWDITVRPDDTSTVNRTGRVYTYSFALFTAANPRPVVATMFLNTTDGFRYRVNTRGLDGNGFAYYGNRVGFLDADGTPLNRDVVSKASAPQSLSQLEGGTRLALPEYPLSLEPLAPETLTALGVPVTPTNPVLNSVSYAGKKTATGSYVNQGGTFTVDTGTAGTYEIVLSRDGVDFDPGLPGNATIRGVVPAAGVYLVDWDGKDNSSAAFPVGDDYAVHATLRGGEYHAPMLDIESSYWGGPTITLENPPSGTCPFTGVPSDTTNCTTAFFDDRGYTTSSGVDVGTPGDPSARASSARCRTRCSATLSSVSTHRGATARSALPRTATRTPGATPPRAPWEMPRGSTSGPSSRAPCRPPPPTCCRCPPRPMPSPTATPPRSARRSRAMPHPACSSTMSAPT